MSQNCESCGGVMPVEDEEVQVSDMPQPDEKGNVEMRLARYGQTKPNPVRDSESVQGTTIKYGMRDYKTNKLQ